MNEKMIRGCTKSLIIEGEPFNYIDIFELSHYGYKDISQLPYCIRVLLESAIRQYDGEKITLGHIETLANWHKAKGTDEVAFMPSRVLLQDFTGVPAVVDLAAMRDAVAKAGVSPTTINPVIPVDLVIDHSVMVDAYGHVDALSINEQKEFERNQERYRFLKWANGTFDNFRVIPPGTGIIHQVNLEYLGSVVKSSDRDGVKALYPDTLVGTDSHTTMINGMGVVGWGVGGIEAEGAMLGQPIYLTRPEVVGVEFIGTLSEGVTATDLALSITELLRSHHVVGKFVEFFGPGVVSMPLADRSTVANMAPEYGATMGYFPIDSQTIDYLNLTGRSSQHTHLVEAYSQATNLFVTKDAPTPHYSYVIQVDLGKIMPSLAGPKRPQDRVALCDLSQSFTELAIKPVNEGGFGLGSQAYDLPKLATKKQMNHGSIVLAAITSCTNTSNPSVMIGAGLLAKKAVEKGLKVPTYVKTSLTPGSKVVTDYLTRSGVMPYLEKLGFNVVGYGCATCIGNSGPLKSEVEQIINTKDLTVASVLSGNRNFEGRIHPNIKANYLGSPMLVVAYALFGTILQDITKEPLGLDQDEKPVYLKDIWPSNQEIEAVMSRAIKAEDYKKRYTNVEGSNPLFNAIEVEESDRYKWHLDSTYIRRPSFFDEINQPVGKIHPIVGAKVLAYLGDSVTTDHISPAGAIAKSSPAGKYLMKQGVLAKDFNSYGSRRGNHEVMVRGTFANTRIRNKLLKDIEGGMAPSQITGKPISIFEAAGDYTTNESPLIILAGKEYGTGSSRDWAAKGTWLLGIKGVLAESFERIHRSNLVGMGVLPLEFVTGENAGILGLTGKETFDIMDLDDHVKPGQKIPVKAHGEDGTKEFEVILRLDSTTEVAYYKNGGILHYLLREQLL